MGKHIETHGDYSEEVENEYKPVFSARTRTVIYVAGLVASVVSLGFITFGDAAVGGFIATAAGIITGGFGVAYNPLRSE